MVIDVVVAQEETHQQRLQKSGLSVKLLTLTWNFPSSTAAECTPELLLLSAYFFFLLCTAGPYFLFIIIFNMLSLCLSCHHFLSLMTTS